MFKSFKSILLAVFVVILSLNSVSLTSFAFEGRVGNQYELLNEEISNFLIDNYKNYYEMSNFDFQYKENDNDKSFLEILVTCDMTLIKKAENLPMLQGMRDSFSEHSNLMMEDIGVYREMSNDINYNYYNKPEKTSFTFMIPKDDEFKIENLKLLIFGEFYELDTLRIDEVSLYENGKELISRKNAQDTIYSENEPVSKYSYGYNRIGARDYALDHAYDSPEYSRDCANFVSQCLCYGGGISSTSSWKPGSANWIRTGYNGNGGVVPYMVDNGYFYREYNRSSVGAGAIVSWRSYSHVGLITYGDSVTIKFSAHTDAKRNEVLPSSANVDYYMYN